MNNGEQGIWSYIVVIKNSSYKTWRKEVQAKDKWEAMKMIKISDGSRIVDAYRK